MGKGKRKSRSIRGRSRGTVRRPKILIICEGENTEVDYFNALIGLFKLNQTVKAQKVADVKSANKKSAFKVAEKNQANAEEIWIVIDREHPQNVAETSFQKNVNEAEGRGDRIIVSNPCFEFWYLLHYKYTTGLFASYDDIEPTLKKFCPEYSKKTADSKRLAKQFVMNETGRTQAIQHAKNVRKHHRSQGNSPRSIPSTEVDRLVSYLDGMRVKPEKGE